MELQSASVFVTSPQLTTAGVAGYLQHEDNDSYNYAMGDSIADCIHSGWVPQAETDDMLTNVLW